MGGTLGVANPIQKPLICIRLFHQWINRDENNGI
jgi:hypothetical protein